MSTTSLWWSDFFSGLGAEVVGRLNNSGQTGLEAERVTRTEPRGRDTGVEQRLPARARLRCGDVDAVGDAMRKGWEAKRQLAAGISNPEVDLAVERALEAGATGVKLTGAGGGGFLLVICPMERQRTVRESLAAMQELPVKLDGLGSRIVLNVMRDIWG